MFTTTARGFSYLHSFNETGAVKRESHHRCQPKGDEEEEDDDRARERKKEA